MRKLLTSVLCLLLVLSLPLSAFAARQTTVSVELGDELGREQYVRDLFDTVAISVANDNENRAVALSLQLGGESVVTFALRLADDGIFVQSEFFGDKALFIGKEDLQKLIINALEQSDSQMSINLIEAGSAFDVKKITEELIEVVASDTVLHDALESILSRTVVTDGEFASSLHDTADRKVEITLTGEDYVKFVDCKTVHYALEKIFKMSSPAISESEINEQIEEVLSEIKKVYTEMNLSIPITLLTADGDKTLVAITADTTATEVSETADESKALNVPMRYYRISSEKCVSRSISMDMILDNRTEAVIKAHLDENSDGTADGLLGILAGPQEINIAFNKTIEADATVIELALHLRENATTLLDLAASARPLITLKVERKDVNGKELAAVAAATKENSLEILKMSQSEMQEWLSGLTTRATQVLYSVLLKMPASVIDNLGNIVPLF